MLLFLAANHCSTGASPAGGMEQPVSIIKPIQLPHVMPLPTYIEPSLAFLADEANWSYQPGGVPATEPMALAALALAAHGRNDAAEKARRKLITLQAADGSLGVTADKPAPQWPTGWAVLAWASADHGRRLGEPYQEHTDRAVSWILSQHGNTWQRSSKLGHDPSLDGWPWVAGTHPWTEPTAINLLSLKAAGQADHPRAREAARLLLDRLLPEGGCNYGNTSVFGRVLRPHVEPSGLALTALAGEADKAGRIEKTLEYLERTLSPAMGGVSLAYGLIGLTAHGRRPAEADQWISEASRRPTRGIDSPLRHALLALAACQHCPLIIAESHHRTPTRSASEARG